MEQDIYKSRSKEMAAVSAGRQEHSINAHAPNMGLPQDRTMCVLIMRNTKIMHSPNLSKINA